MPYQYPANSLDNAQTLLGLVGEFWSSTYAGNFLVESLLYARGRLQAQADNDFQELLGSVSLQKIPPLHTDLWQDLVILESQVNQSAANLAKFDGAYLFDGTLAFDVPETTAYFVWPLPPDVVDVAVITDRIYNPTKVFIRGVDFFLADGAVWFREDPFAFSIDIQEVFVDDVVSDRQGTLWLYRGQHDVLNLNTQFGYVVGLHLPSSEAYRQLLQAVYGNLVSGATNQTFYQALSALCDVPLALGNETVQYIIDDRRQTWVITDQHAYGVHLGSTLLVAVGDTLREGDALTDTLQVFEFTRGLVPPAEQLRALSVGKGVLAEGYFHDLVFENKTVNWLVEDEVDGYTKMSFEIGGNDLDVDAFWDEVHRRGVLRDQTLAMLLDKRPPEARDRLPTPAALPTTVNPLGFLIQNLFRNNLGVIKVRPAFFGPNALGLGLARLLRRLVPPQSLFFVVSELTRAETLTMEDVGSSTRPGYTETGSTFPCMTAAEILDHGRISERCRCFQVRGRCA